MAMRDLIPWNRNREISVRRDDTLDPFIALQRSMNRLFDDFFRSDLAPFGAHRWADDLGWPKIEVSEAGNDVKVTAELPGLDDKDIEVEVANGVLAIRGEKKMETEDKDRLFSERFYGRFERRIPLDGVDEDNVSASFRNGVLTVVLPKSAKAQERTKRIAIKAQ